MSRRGNHPSTVFRTLKAPLDYFVTFLLILIKGCSIKGFPKPIIENIFLLKLNLKQYHYDNKNIKT